MKVLRLFMLLALIPTFTFASSSNGAELYGLWYDDYTDVKLEIKHTRKGIKVKHHGGLFPRWHTYNYMGRGLYDDCDGKVIIVRGYDQIEWRKGRRRSFILTRYANRGYRERPYDRYNDGYSRNRNRSYDRNYGRGPARERYCGSWYNADRGFNLAIEAYGVGFRARFGNEWTYYEPYQDHFRDRRGNRYYIDDRFLSWRSFDGRKRLRFRRR